MSRQNSYSTQQNLSCLMVDYAAGTLDEGLALVIASYISLSPYAQTQLRQLEHIGGALLCQDCTPVAMNRNSLHNVLERLENEESPPPSSTKAAMPEQTETIPPTVDAPCDMPAPLARHIAGQRQAQARTKALKWKRRLRGIHVIDIPLGHTCNSQVQLIKIDPAITTPDHTHRGLELTLILDGAFTDETGAHKTGAMLVHDEAIQHQPVSCAEKGCICLVATDAPLRFTRGWIRLLNPFIR